MSLFLPAAALLTALGLLLLLLMALSQRALLAQAAPPLPAVLPPLSILKPLKGVDAGLEENLRSLFRQNYPEFELILGTEDASDPALALARKVASEFPGVRSMVRSSPAGIGFNPKVNNLAQLLPHARHELILISDSNVRADPAYLADLVAHREVSGAGLVWSLFRGTGWQGLGGALEALQINGHVMGGLSGLVRLLGMPCAVGKSMLLDRGDLDRIGGLPYLGQFLAEDQVCAEDFVAAGRPVVVSGRLIDNVLGRRSLREAVGRHLRWARLRRHMNLPGYLGEGLLNPVFVALVAALGVRSADAWGLAAGALAAVTILDRSSERRIGIRRPLWKYPVLELILGVSRGLLWFVPLFSNAVCWRGRRLSLGPRSRILLEGTAGLEATRGLPPRVHA